MPHRLRRLLPLLVVIPLGLALAAGWHLLQSPRARRPARLAVDRSPARVERGEYLVRHVAACFHCHSPVDSSRLGSPPIPGQEGRGRVMDPPEGGGTLVAGNLTSDAETGLGKWSDDQILRAIREGVGADGRALHPLMPSAWYRALGDDDAHAIVAYLRTLAPARADLPETSLPAMTRLAIASGPEPLISAVPPPPEDDAVARGAYLARVAGCVGCHSRVDSLLRPLPSSQVDGGRVFRSGGREMVAPNLTPFPTTFIGRSTAEAFGARFRASGAHAPGQEPVVSPELNSVMPWTAHGGMTPSDLRDLHAYLRSLTPVDAAP